MEMNKTFMSPPSEISLIIRMQAATENANSKRVRPESRFPPRLPSRHPTQFAAQICAPDSEMHLDARWPFAARRPSEFFATSLYPAPDHILPALNLPDFCSVAPHPKLVRPNSRSRTHS